MDLGATESVRQDHLDREEDMKPNDCPNCDGYGTVITGATYSMDDAPQPIIEDCKVCEGTGYQIMELCYLCEFLDDNRIKSDYHLYYCCHEKAPETPGMDIAKIDIVQYENDDNWVVELEIPSWCPINKFPANQ